MSEFAGSLPRKFISFRHLGFESSAHILPEMRESENHQNVADGNTVVVGETSRSLAEITSILQLTQLGGDRFRAKVRNEDCDLTMAEKDCILSSSDDDVEDLSAFVTERLQSLSEGGLEKFIGKENVNLEQILCGNIDFGKIDGSKRPSVCPNVTPGGDVGGDDERFSPGVEINQSLREELGSANITSTPKRTAWPIYTKRCSSVSRELDEPVCKAVMFDVASGSGTAGVGEILGGNVINPSEGVADTSVTSGGFLTLEGIAQRQADERLVGACIDGEEEGMVRIPPVEEMFLQEATTKERMKFYPSQSAKSFLKEYFALNPPTHLDPSHATTNFSADQIIQFAWAVGLEVSLASHSMLEDLLLKARGGSGAHSVPSRYPVGRSQFSSVAGSSIGSSVASRSAYSLPTITETEGTNVILGGDVVEELCSSRHADPCLAMGMEGSEKPGTDCLKTLQQNKLSQKKKTSLSCKWSREGRLYPLLPSGDDKAIMCSRRRCWSSLFSLKCWQLVLTIRWKTSIAFSVCYVDETSL